MNKMRKSKTRKSKIRRGGNLSKLQTETPFEGKLIGGALNTETLFEPVNKLIGGALNTETLFETDKKLIGGALVGTPYNDNFIGGSYKKRKSMKRKSMKRKSMKRKSIKRGGAQLGSFLGGTQTISDTFNKLFGTGV